jgi:hypothetical protein
VALRIRFLGPTGSTLGYSIERLSDGSLYDFSTSLFTSGTPTTSLGSLPENTPSFPGQYKTTLSPTPVSQFSNGDYAITVIDRLANLCVGIHGAVMAGGDDTSVIPGGPVASVVAPVTVGTNNDKTGYALSQSFPSNFSSLAITSGGAVTAGTVADKAGYSLSQAFPVNFANLAIDSATGGITVRGYASGQDPASLVLASPANKLATDGSGRITAGTVADKSGYALAAAGLDSITVETGINARQALSPILAASAGVITGAGTGTIVIQSANGSTSRIVATTDNAGNRLSVVLALPN